MKKTISIAVFILLSLSLFAQNEIDALRYSRSFFGGTARSMSMGGAFGALGSDLSVLSYNPAGIAVFQKTELSASPCIYFNNTEAEFFEDQSVFEDNKYNFNFNNIGLAASYRSGDDEEWANVNFGIAYNRMNNFHQNIHIEGENNTSSMIDNFVDNAWGTHPDDLWAYRERLAFDTWLIDTIPYTNYEYGYALQKLGVTQRKTIQTEGAMGEYAFSVGANYGHKFYVGATFGIQSLRYDMNSIYREDNNDMNTTEDVRYWWFREDLRARGTGFNFKFGMIVKPVYWMRIGAAIHTPTFLDIEEEYDTEMYSKFDLPDNEGYTDYQAQPTDIDGFALGPNVFIYQITTPLKAMGSVAFVFGSQGLISFDYEYVDYSKIKMSADDADFTDTKQVIQEVYGAAHNIRAGAEFLAGPVSLRAGAAYYGSPYEDAGEKEDASVISFSGGMGINSGSFYFDFGYVHYVSSHTRYLYDTPAEVPLVGADIASQTGKIMATLGVRF